MSTELSRAPYRVPDERLRASHAKKKAFLASYAESLQVAAACRAAGVSVSLIPKWAKADPDFEKAFREISEAIGHAAESEALRRAIDGWDEPLMFKGEQVGVVRRFSDNLLAQILRAKRPEYREQGGGVHVHAHGQNVGVAVLPATMLDEASWERMAADLTRTQNQIAGGQIIEGTAERVPDGAPIKRG